MFMPKKASRVEKIFLDHKRKKKCVDKDGYYGFTIYPRALHITWGNTNWSWTCFKETSDDKIEVAKLESVCWVDVRGFMPLSELTAGVTYESVFLVKLTKSATGWELPIKLSLSVHGENTKGRQVIMFRQPKGVWFELNLGTFQVGPNAKGEIGCGMYEYGGHWKSGLIVKALIIRPKL